MSVDLRPAEAGDEDRILEVARSSLTTSASLSPQQIESIVEEQFAADPLEMKRDASDTVLLVAEVDDVVAGFVEGSLSEGRGEVRWLHVDPERRGQGVGTELMDATTDELRERGAKHVYAAALAANTEGGAFFERSGFEQTDEREVTIGDQELIEHIYVATDSDGEESTDDEPAGGEADGDEPADGEESTDEEESTDTEETPPDTVSSDGDQLFVGDEEMSGTEAPFYRTYSDDGRTDQFGYYCANCGSTDVAMDDMERIKCSECGNEHRPDEGYDASYL